MQEPCAVCYVTFEKFLSNEAFSISGKLLCDMILDAVQGVLQPYILVLNDYSALVVFSQKELDAGQMKVDQLVKKLYNRRSARCTAFLYRDCEAITKPVKRVHFQ